MPTAYLSLETFRALAEEYEVATGMNSIELGYFTFISSPYVQSGTAYCLTTTEDFLYHPHALDYECVEAQLP